MIDSSLLQLLGILVSGLWALQRLLTLIFQEVKGGSAELRLLKEQLRAANAEHKMLLGRILSRLDDAVEAANR